MSKTASGRILGKTENISEAISENYINFAPLAAETKRLPTLILRLTSVVSVVSVNVQFGNNPRIFLTILLTLDSLGISMPSKWLESAR